MSKKKVRLPPFIMLRKDLLRDTEWKKLSNSAKIAWIYLRNNYDYANGSKESFLTYNQMQGIMAAPTLSKSLKELVESKWIEKTKNGGLFGGVCRYKFVGNFADFGYKGRVI